MIIPGYSMWFSEVVRVSSAVKRDFRGIFRRIHLIFCADANATMSEFSVEQSHRGRHLLFALGRSGGCAHGWSAQGETVRSCGV